MRRTPFKVGTITNTGNSIGPNIVCILGGHGGTIGVSGGGLLRPFCVICLSSSNRIVYSRLRPGGLLSALQLLYGSGGRCSEGLYTLLDGRAYSNERVRRCDSLLRGTVSDVMHVGRRDSVSDLFALNRAATLAGRVGKLSSFRLVAFLIVEWTVYLVVGFRIRYSGWGEACRCVGFSQLCINGPDDARNNFL